MAPRAPYMGFISRMGTSNFSLHVFVASVQRQKKRTCRGLSGSAHGVLSTVNIISSCSVSAISFPVS